MQAEQRVFPAVGDIDQAAGIDGDTDNAIEDDPRQTGPVSYGLKPRLTSRDERFCANGIHDNLW